jgi:Tol biopolymer transport system component
MSAFDRSGRFETELSEILTEIVSPRLPDYVDDLLARTAVTRQRPRWTFLERWLPMDLTARPVPFPAPPWRILATIAVLLALLAAGLLIAGSQQPRVPAPFGPARNGALLFGEGDIYVRDSLTGSSTMLIGGSSDDFAASFTRDGTRVTFLRRTEGIAGTPSERLQAWIANRDGSQPKAITEPMSAPDWFDLSPDDSLLVVAAGDPSIGQRLLAADASRPTGASRLVDLGDPDLVVSFPNFLGPTGSEIVFRGRTSTNLGDRSGIFAARPDGTGLRRITPTDGDVDEGYLFPQPAPDGSAIAYTSWDRVAEQNRIHIVDLRTGTDRIVSDPARNQGFATFSPDSRRIVFVTNDGQWHQITVAPVDGSGPQVSMGRAYLQVRGQYLTGFFSPDGRSVIVTDPASKETRLVDVVNGGKGELLPWATGGISGWQRLAP